LTPNHNSGTKATTEQEVTVKNDKELTFIHTTVYDGLVSNASSFAMIVGIIGLGVFLGSSAMQWAGFIIAAVFIVARSMKTKRMTEDEAFEFLKSRRGGENV
jgi:D-arabinose 1-dehydrogenase-like Zn-dependent alcohol dehydrogenase